VKPSFLGPEIRDQNGKPLSRDTNASPNNGLLTKALLGQGRTV
jgi:hypothetical protein